jgi:hypothetical protein
MALRLADAFVPFAIFVGTPAPFAEASRSVAATAACSAQSVEFTTPYVALRRRRTLGPVLAVSRNMPGTRPPSKTLAIAPSGGR